MTKRVMILSGVLALVVSFAVGRYSVQAPSTTATSHTETDTKKDKDTHKHIDTTTVETPDGTKTTHTTTDEDTTSHEDKSKQSDKKTVEVAATRSTLNVSGLAGVDTLDRFKPVYGVAINKEFIGPVTIGAFALTNGVVGLSVGVNF